MDPTPGAAGVTSAICGHCGAPFEPKVKGQHLCDACQGLSPTERARPEQEAMVPGYTLVHELGAGRFATSWLGEDEHGGSAVVKLLRSYAPDPNSVQRFLAEAQRLESSPDLRHPGIARLLSAGVHLVQALFLVYESGGEITLADELRARGRIAPARSLELCAQLADALAALHRAGVLHLDLKPANVALTRLADGTEQAVLLDVATSHLLGKAGLYETQKLPLSTAAYQAPEESHGVPADLFALGVLLYQLISGRLPVMGSTAAELQRAYREHGPLRLRDAGRKVHPELEALLARMMARDPEQRFSSGDELAVVLRAMIPLADAPPPEGTDGPEVEDPLPVLTPPPPELIEPLEADSALVEDDDPVTDPVLAPALKRALLGDVQGAGQPDPAPGVPSWMPRVRPRWALPAMVGAVVLGAIIAAALVLSSGSSARRARKERARAEAPVAAAPGSAERAAVPAAPAAAQPARPEPRAETSAPKPAAPRPAVPKPAAPKSAATKSAAPAKASPKRRAVASDELLPPSAAPATITPLTKAQRQIGSGHAAQAVKGLQALLAQADLSQPDRARAMRLMGDAKAKLGDKQAAIDWYRKFLSLNDEPAERPRVVKRIHALSR